jgi:hypothetical protein
VLKKSVFWRRCYQSIAIAFGLWLILDIVARLGAEIFWFQEVGYLQVFSLRLLTQGLLWAIGFGITALYLLGNLVLAEWLVSDRTKGVRSQESEVRSISRTTQPPTTDQQLVISNYQLPTTSYQLPRTGAKQYAPTNYQLPLRLFLPLVLLLNLLVGLLLWHYGHAAGQYLQPDLNLPNISPLIPKLFRPALVLALGKRLVSQIWVLGLLGGLAIALLFYTRFFLWAIAIAFSAIFGLILSGHWARIWQYLNPTAFNSADPVFHRDLSFYVFTLPIGELLEFWLVGMFLYGLIAVVLTYLLAGDNLNQGRFDELSRSQQRHLEGLGSCFMLAVALSYWLNRYELLYSRRGVTYGASYTDVTIELPADTFLSLLAVAIALLLCWGAVFGYPKHWSRKLLVWGIGADLLIALVTGTLLPSAVQRFLVLPNELELERPYIERSIALTRQAFNLAIIDDQTFDPQNDLTYADIQANDLTIRNIRLWDQRPLLKTNRQLQQIRPYYRFSDADIDRYTLLRDTAARRPSSPSPAPTEQQPGANAADTERRQTLIAARELDYSTVPQAAQTWVNQHLIYTHGYGFTLSPVNTVAAGGLPEYFVKDIGDTTTDGTLTVSSEAIRDSIPIGQPRIYFGEITNTYVMTGTRTQELDYPSGNENVYNVYDGRGGINIGSFWQRLLLAKYLHDWQMLLTQDFTPQTKLLFRRNINQRIRAIAPFLRYDRDPYLVAADAGDKQSSLYWIVDAYTTSERYPYAEPGKEGINYIRNSVKVIIDAYHGEANFYIADPDDPIIRTWQKVFPGLFQPFSNLPKTLQVHIRYPQDLFSIQAERLLIYHMTDPQVFYNQEDLWQIPTEVYGDEARLVEPYYLITSLPTVPFEEFILLLPYIPNQRTNLIAWLAARSDGENYGRLLLYEFPKQRLVYGPEQIEARINQDPVISQQISLWNRRGSRSIQGNLLVIPIEQSLLYVEPIYLEATQNSLPTLARVIVAYENRIVMAETLEQALKAVFQAEETPAQPIIRPVEEQ